MWSSQISVLLLRQDLDLLNISIVLNNIHLNSFILNYDIANVRACGILEELFGLGKSINRLPKSCPPLMQCRQLQQQQQQLVEMSCDKTSQNFFFGSSKRSAEISILREEAFLITFFSSLKMHCCPTLEAGFSIHSSSTLSRVLIWDKDKNLLNLFENTLWNLTDIFFCILIYRWISPFINNFRRFWRKEENL